RGGSPPSPPPPSFLLCSLGLWGGVRCCGLLGETRVSPRRGTPWTVGGCNRRVQRCRPDEGTVRPRTDSYHDEPDDSCRLWTLAFGGFRRKAPRIRCPLCGCSPRKDDRWSCTCGHIWNTFDTGGVCPACLKQRSLLC